MDLMMYFPKLDDDTKIINKRINLLGHTIRGEIVGDSLSSGAYSELLGMGKYIAGHLLNAWENPPPKHDYFNQNAFYENLNRLLVAMIERDDLSLEQLQRYRRLITSEKL